ncbi:MAG: hypothetical protein P8Y97_16865 [Candidatus Lokiarchaeota archaeon]
MLGNSRENEIETVKEGQRRIIVAKMMSSSNDPYIKIGENIPIREKLADDEYNIGDIIVFKKGGNLKVMHQITNKYKGADGKIYYVTQGLNRDTNPFSDTRDVSEDDVIGIADISEEAFTAMQEIIERQSGGIIKVYGVPSHFEQFTNALSTIIRGFTNDMNILNTLIEILDLENLLEQIESEDQRRIINSFLELTYRIHNLDKAILGSRADFLVSRGKIMSILKPQLIDLCNHYLISSQHLSPQSHQLIEIFTKLAHILSDKRVANEIYLEI